jgi:hypothetical protein
VARSDFAHIVTAEKSFYALQHRQGQPLGAHYETPGCTLGSERGGVKQKDKEKIYRMRSGGLITEVEPIGLYYCYYEENNQDNIKKKE